MWRPDYHTTVSFDRPAKPNYWENGGGTPEQKTQVQEVRTLPRTIDYSAGLAYGSGNQQHNRYLLLVKSDDPLGATYLVMRDTTVDGQPNQHFTWNLWCMAKEPEITGNVAHFPGQFGVDLDAHLLVPANPQFVKDSFGYEQWVYPWWGLGKLREDQTGVHVHKSGSNEDFFSVLYPRAAGQGPAQVTALANGQALTVTHMEGTDVVLLSPGKPAMVTSGDVQLTGEIAFARRYNNGIFRLAVVKGAGASAASGEWKVQSDGPVALTINGATVNGESSGDAHTVLIRLPINYTTASVTLDGKPLEIMAVKWETLNLSLNLPAGLHTFTISTK